MKLIILVVWCLLVLLLYARPITSNNKGMSSKRESIQSRLMLNLKIWRTNLYVRESCAGIGSGVVASVVCAPIDLVRTRLQVVGGINECTKTQKSLGFFKTLRNIFYEEGLLG